MSVECVKQTFTHRIYIILINKNKFNIGRYKIHLKKGPSYDIFKMNTILFKSSDD